MARIFFDHISTTPLDSRVFEAMKPYFLELYGNPSSHIHDQGQAALKAVDAARSEVAALLNASPDEIVFTSGATEANNLAVKGAAEANGKKGRHIVVSDVEHFSVQNALIPLRNRGYEVTTLKVDSDGRVDPGDVRRAIRPDTALVSVMHANSEIGTIEPVAEIGRIARERGVLARFPGRRGFPGERVSGGHRERPRHRRHGRGRPDRKNRDGGTGFPPATARAAGCGWNRGHG